MESSLVQIIVVPTETSTDWCMFLEIARLATGAPGGNGTNVGIGTGVAGGVEKPQETAVSAVTSTSRARDRAIHFSCRDAALWNLGSRAT